MRVLVTGGGGFVGSYLVESQLAQGHQVRVLDLHTENLAHLTNQPGLEVLTGDITDPECIAEAVAGVDAVYHLASAHLDTSLPAKHYWRVNVQATQHLLKAAHAAGVGCLVHCSTNGVVGEAERLPIDETTACRPTNIYEQTKLAGEQIALRYCHEQKFPVVVARPAWVYGPRCPRTRKLFRTIGKGRFVMLGDGSTLRHPIYVTDLVRGLELCSKTEKAVGEVYFIAGAQPVTIQTLVETIAAIQGVRPPKLHLPLTIGKVLGYALQLACKPLGLRPPFSRRSVDFYIKNNAYEIGKAKRDLGFQPYTSLDEGLAMTYRALNGPLSEASIVNGVGA